jgi:hypothetical protein
MAHKGYRVLCHNCNLARGFYGYCPHEKFDGNASSNNKATAHKTEGG